MILNERHGRRSHAMPSPRSAAGLNFLANGQLVQSQQRWQRPVDKPPPAGPWLHVSLRILTSCLQGNLNLVINLIESFYGVQCFQITFRVVNGVSFWPSVAFIRPEVAQWSATEQAAAAPEKTLFSVRFSEDDGWGGDSGVIISINIIIVLGIIVNEL
jgi:hypothetical protein